MIKKQIPNIVTGFNLVSGCISIVFSFSHSYELAIIAIFVAAVFDFFDGFVARLLNVMSPIGKEMDSLADVVSFGVSPAMVLFCYMKELETVQPLAGWQHYLPYLVFIVPMFSALRLAKFNLDTRQTLSFLGLPTPANALFLSTLILLPKEWSFIHNIYVLIAISILTSFLLVSEIPLFAMKFKSFSWNANTEKYIFLLGIIPITLIFGLQAVPFVILWYIILSIGINGYYKYFKRQAKKD
jgi:CDP-diacylglycerol--serine O-phosphatidyltransferase